MTSHNRINSAEIIGYNPYFENNKSLNIFIITNNDQLSFNYLFYFYHKFYNAAHF